MAYPHEGEIRRWLENWVRWSPPGSFGKSQWSVNVTSSNVFEGTPVPIMSGAAADTQDALKRLDRQESRLLTQYHLGRSSKPSVMARRRRISLKTLERQLHVAHEHFWELRQSLRAGYRVAGERNAELSKVTAQRRRTTAYEDTGRLQRNRPKSSEGGAR